MQRTISPGYIKSRINSFQEALGLQRWTINFRVRLDSSMGLSLMKVNPLRERHMAFISVRESSLTKSHSEFDRLLLHEMLHLVLDPIAEEHSFQTQFCIPPERVTECEIRFVRELEKVTEHLALAISKMQFDN